MTIVIMSNSCLDIAAIFKWVSKAIRDCFGLLHWAQPIRRKTKTNINLVTRVFPHFRPVTCTLKSDWSLMTFTIVLIGRCQITLVLVSRHSIEKHSNNNQNNNYSNTNNNSNNNNYSNTTTTTNNNNNNNSNSNTNQRFSVVLRTSTSYLY